MAANSLRSAASRKTLLAAGIAASVAAGVLAGLGAGTAAQAGAGNPAMPQAHSDGVGAALADTVITAKLKLRFAGDDRLTQSSIGVVTINGVVRLSGTATGAEAKAVADNLAGSIDGVISVDDELVTPATAAAVAAAMDKAAVETRKAAADGWITAQVKSGILADRVSRGFDVSVATWDGVVVLSGTLANEAAIGRVAEIARRVKGVRSVDVSALSIASI